MTLKDPTLETDVGDGAETSRSSDRGPTSRQEVLDRYGEAQVQRQDAVSSRTRSEHDALVAAMEYLEAALASAAPGREADWGRRVHRDLQEVEGRLREHIDSSEGEEGLYAELDLCWPTRVNQVDELRQDHQDLVGQVRDLLRITGEERPDGAVPHEEVRRRARKLLTRMRRHQARETDLIFECFYTDIGVGD